MAINSDNIADRVKLCWGHLRNWQRLKIVQESKKWLQKTNASFTPTTFIAYDKEKPVGMIEFIPQKNVRKYGLCPCRASPEAKSIEGRYSLGKEFDDCLFISCLWVKQDYQGRGIGKALLSHFLNSEVFKDSSGALVYVAERDVRWEKHISWPTGSKEFYLKGGFSIVKTLDRPIGYLLHYRKKQS